MALLDPSDDAICTAAATLASAMMREGWRIPEQKDRSTQTTLGAYFTLAIRTIQAELDTIRD